MDYWDSHVSRRWIHGALMDSRFILIGAGSFARELINYAYDFTHGPFKGGFNAYLGPETAFDGYSYKLDCLGMPEDYVPAKDDLFVVAISDPSTKKRLVTRLKGYGAKFVKFIHPSAVIAKTAFLGEGIVVCPNSVITADSKVGAFVTVNALSSIGHDARIGDFSTLSAHVDLTGFVQVGELSFFGTGAKVVPRVRIGKNAKIGAGTTIIRSVPDDAVMYSMPAKKL